MSRVRVEVSRDTQPRDVFRHMRAEDGFIRNRDRRDPINGQFLLAAQQRKRIQNPRGTFRVTGAVIAGARLVTDDFHRGGILIMEVTDGHGIFFKPTLSETP